MKSDINHPSYYGGDTTYEAVKVIKAWGLNFNRGNVLKYVCRAGEKDPTEEIKDLEKARWYLNAEIEYMKMYGGLEIEEGKNSLEDDVIEYLDRQCRCSRHEY